ncbi:MAG: superoxide dismutase [Candidatus Vogelbacteria bacterium CG22_combo_CG10-13_8_21_14_all_37_9]|uniref:Superoxide dismutase n=1 Tax=Candidatus Vogelbacteria bacterium CG22_combo_CG10-13_8_21_14_all_37_9 TaxID=1975046 RepID=A0A2H0BL67_9BACT|nr:MAG: superoxide dismutase [bacterium CG10_37_50]PIP58426.1 MAG: superoxide dismutase [Candidatus Vogelbacteria bacterium CG22_combo_CG10-13_8_21_14_all_37_9]
MYKLNPLNYGYADLEPYFDEATMKLHHDKHHQSYLDKLNLALTNSPDLAAQPIEDLLTNLATLPEELKSAVRNSGGGYANHNLFFNLIGPHSDQTEATGDLAEAIKLKFSSFEQFKKDFTEKALSVFGSGWVWLTLDQSGLQIVTTANQDSPLSLGLQPILACDVWEHAYYLKYQNRRVEFIDAFFQVVDWPAVAKHYDTIKNNLKV